MFNTDRPEVRHPVYWFVILQQAVDSHDFGAAAQAQRELEKLGVRVRYDRPRRRRA